LNWSKWIRQIHRWLSIAFTAGFIVNIIALTRGGEPAFWVYLLVLIPLFLLFPTGLYMFVQPYAAKWRSARGAGGQA
jgi:cellulose synthase/poly-beta-1,6-N-acetylglucosamine synthase-like glycosyltransferase